MWKKAMPLIFILFFLVPNLLFAKTVQAVPHVKNGVIDLSSWSFHDKGIIMLDGQWEFYWEELITPQSIQNHKNAKSLIEVPKIWGSQYINSKKLSNQGYGTYRLVMKLNQNDIDQQLALHMPGTASAYKLWINGELIKEQGRVGAVKEKMAPKSYPEPLFFSTNKKEVELVIQVSNFSQRKGGIWDEIKLGHADQIIYSREKSIGKQLLLAGGLLVVGLYHVGLYIFSRRFLSALFFGIVCLLMFLRKLAVGDVLLVRYFPSVGWELANKIEYMSVSLSVAIFVLYVHQLYLDESNKNVTYFFNIGFSILSILILILPTVIFTQGMVPLQLFALLAIIYITIVLFRATLRKQQGAMLNFIFAVILILAVINDIFFYSFLIKTGDLSPVVIYLFIFGQTIVLSSRYISAFDQVENLTFQLQETNETLEKKVKDRTKALVESNDKLQKIEVSRKKLLSTISHDIGTPLSSILGYTKAIKDGILPSDDQKTIDIIYSKAIILKRLTDDLRSLIKLESDELVFNKEIIEFSMFYRLISGKYDMDVAERGIRFVKNELILSKSERLYLNVDIDRMEQVVMNLISNAIHHTGEGGEITICARYFSCVNKIIIKVKDTGIGISKIDLPFIFNRSYKGEGKDYHGSGLGLAISKEIIEKHGGRIGVLSREGVGSTFYFILPIVKGEEN